MLYRSTDKTEATEIVIIDSQMDYRGKLDTYPMIHSALFSIAFLCYNNGSETAVYMISLVGETAPSILKLFEESLLKPWVGFFHVLIT